MALIRLLTHSGNWPAGSGLQPTHNCPTTNEKHWQRDRQIERKACAHPIRSWGGRPPCTVLGGCLRRICDVTEAFFARRSSRHGWQPSVYEIGGKRINIRIKLLK